MLAVGSPVPASDRQQHTGDLVFGCAPAASSRVVLHSTQTASDPVATCTSAASLGAGQSAATWTGQLPGPRAAARRSGSAGDWPQQP